MFCLLVVLAKLSLLAKWLARKTPLRKPNRGEGIISIKPGPKSAHDFIGLLYCVIVLLCICVVSCPYMIYYPTVMARYSLFVLKVPLNPKQTNKHDVAGDTLRAGSDCRPDDWEGVVLCSGPQLRTRLRVHLPRRNVTPLDVPLLLRSQRNGNFYIIYFIEY